MVTLSEENKTFVQKYNAKIKYNEPTNGISIPNGVTIKSCPRRNKTPQEEKEDKDNEDKPASMVKKARKESKKVKFSDPQMRELNDPRLPLPRGQWCWKMRR
jgi:hypothetical protein